MKWTLILTMVFYFGISTPTQANQVIPYQIIEKRDTSYGEYKGTPGANRLVYSIYLETNSKPHPERMKVTAKQIWEKESKKWDELTVFMIFGEIKDFSMGAYGIVTFNKFKMTDFQINNTPLVILNYLKKTNEKGVR